MNGVLKEKVRIGCIGFSWDQWVGIVYPSGTSPQNMLSEYAKQFDAVELGITFQGVPSLNVVHGWHKKTPQDFKFTAKLPREISHAGFFKDTNFEFTLFLERMRELGEKLGVILIQLPPFFGFGHLGQLRSFLKLIPKDVRFAVEPRNISLLRKEFFDLLSEHNVALCQVDSGRMGKVVGITSDFTYIRLLGDPKPFRITKEPVIPRHEDVRKWAEVIRDQASRVKSVYVFTDDGYEGFSPITARKVQIALGLWEYHGRPEEMDVFSFFR